jgi:arylsulfatase A-like enzyme
MANRKMADRFLQGPALSILAGVLAMLLVLFAETIFGFTSGRGPGIPPIGAFPDLLALYATLGAVLGLLAFPLLRRRAGESRATRVAGGAAGLAVAYALFWRWNQASFPDLLEGRLLLRDLGAVLAGLGVGWIGRRLLRPGLARLVVAAPLALALALAAAGGWLPSLGGQEPFDEPARIAGDRPNVLLLTIDTLRANSVGAYGYGRARTPNIDRLAAEGLRFENAYTPVPQTGPSHATLLTGLHPIRHGVLYNGWRLAGRHLTLAEILKANGYETFGVVSVEHIASSFGFGQGIDVFIDHHPIFDRFYAVSPSLGLRFSLVQMISHNALREFEAGWFNPGSHERRADRTIDRILERMRERSDAPFFVWVHLFDPHSPYEPPPGFAESFRNVAVDLPETPFPVEETRGRFDRYDGEVAFVDEQVGRLLRALAPELGDTLVVFVADHGESLGEAGYRGHSGHVREEVVRVPLLLRWPGRVPAGKTEGRRTFTTDVVPAILSLLGLPIPAGLDGRDPREGGPDRPLFLQAQSPSGFRLRGVLEGDHKVFLTWPVATQKAGWSKGKWHAYHLRRDPGERRNLAKKQQRHETLPLTGRLVADTRAYFESADVERQEIGLSAIRALKSLGYLP